MTVRLMKNGLSNILIMLENEYEEGVSNSHLRHPLLFGFFNLFSDFFGLGEYDISI